MHAIDESRLVLSATDLSNHLACGHATLLDRAVALGRIGKPPKFDDPGLDVVRQRGLEHERAYVGRLRAAGRTVVEVRELEVPMPPLERWRRLARETEAAMRAGADVIYQGCLFDGTWLGRPDFLERVDTPSRLGPWSYEVVDTKLAREAKAGALLQVLLYAELLERVQGVAPERVRLELGGPEPRAESFRVAHYSAYFRSIRRRLLATLAGAPAEPAVAPEPVAHCDLCAWRMHCDGERREVDHLSLVAGIRRGERRALVARGIATVETLAKLPLPLAPRLGGVSGGALGRVREQARVQVEGRTAGRPVHELLEPVSPERGLALLPAPSDGDLFFDIEGDPYALGHGLEYLFGFVNRSGASTSWWALDRALEKRVFERFIDFVIARLDECPDLHVYHYAAYEPAAIKRLMGRHATREDEVDRLLRGRVFVDLYRVVRQGVRASVESYSIKRLEPFYGYTRNVDLRSASSALANFEAWLEMGGATSRAELGGATSRAEMTGGDTAADQRRSDDSGRTDALLAEIEGYNRDDCVSTLRLADWLERQRAELERRAGQPIPRPGPVPGDPPDPVAEEQGVVAALVERLTDGVVDDPEHRTADQHACWLLAQLLGFHRRENKATWWEFFRRMELSDDELIEDRATLGGLTYEGVVESVKRSHIHRYRFPPQDHDVGPGVDVRDPATARSAGTVVAVDDDACTIDLKRGTTSQVPQPRALVPLEFVDDGVMRESLQGFARDVIEHGMCDANPCRAAVDLLLARAPRIAASDASSANRAGASLGRNLMRNDESTLDAARRLVLELDRSVLPIQGPPGAGKTYTAARMIVAAAGAGKRVGITATSHKVIAHLLDETCDAAREAGVELRVIQKAKPDQACDRPQIARTDDNGEVRRALDCGEATVAAGTAWLWSRDDMRAAVDLLVVDEAGQFSLANALAVAPAAASLVLVGDPRQLQQPQQGVHPPGVELSALEHLLHGHATIPPGRGLFLARTWRLHPELCAFTSELFYDGRLEPVEGLERQRVIAAARVDTTATDDRPITIRDPLDGSGLRLVTIEHDGRQSESPEEVAAVAALVARALAGGRWVDAAGAERALQPEDILVVAPYNAQVAALRIALPQCVRVGTVDRFQGQQAPVVIYSMTTSSAADAPRGMDFLYDLNRLNVATSRARCLAIVVASPKLFAPECRTPEQMRLANGACAVEERAGRLAGRASLEPLSSG